jgi:hypothetical protein
MKTFRIIERLMQKYSVGMSISIEGALIHAGLMYFLLNLFQDEKMQVS